MSMFIMVRIDEGNSIKDSQGQKETIEDGCL